MMWKYTIQVDGMMCGMCESHVNDAVRKAFPVKKVTSSRSKKETAVITETELDEETLCAAISATGYEVGDPKGALGEEGPVWPVRSRYTVFGEEADKCWRNFWRTGETGHR